MNTKRILYVEDKDDNLESLQEAIDSWNLENAETNRCFNMVGASSKEDAYDKIDQFNIDCALIDLKLPEKENSRTSATFGNELADEILSDYGLPVGIISANPRELSEKLSGMGIIKAFNKVDDDAFVESVAWFAGHWKMLDALASARKQLAAVTAPVFVKRLWPHWSKISTLANDDNEKLSTMISRQFASHAADLMGLANDASWHPFESYVTPSFLEDRAHTGDIFNLDKKLWVVLTPQCDMAIQKVSSIILVECVRGREDWDENVKALKAAKSKTKKKEPTKFLKSLVNQNLSPSEHFLPPLPDSDEPLIVKFSHVRTIDLAELNGALSHRLASISSPFLSNLVQRFGACLSRTGQPDIDVSHF